MISDFRRADLAAGGQGAPLVPFADYILFRHPTKNRVLLNIGGIANLTWLKAGGTIDDVIAFDTGPGNCVIDHVCRKEFPHGPGYDPDGQLSRGAPPSKEVMRDLLTEVSRSGGRGFSDAVDLAIATMACHGSIRAGDALSPSEAKALLVALDDADFAGHCPHGRPVVTFLSYVELERKVGRR